MMTATPPPLPTPSDWDVPSTRVTVLVVAAANTVFWLWTFRFIAAHSNPKSDGFEWVAVMPFGAIFFGLVVPAIMRAFRMRGLGLAIVLVLGATMLNAMLYLQILGEFNQSK